MCGDFVGNESATAYGLGIIAIFLVVCTSVATLMVPLMNGMINQYNSQVDDGYVSEQRGDNMDFLLILWKGLPVWSVLGVIAWGVVRALEHKSSEVG